MPMSDGGKEKEENFLRKELLQNIKKNHFQLKQLSDLISELGEDEFYRFYHQSFKVYRLQERTEQIVKLLKELLPNRELNNWFLAIVREGTGRQFSERDNQQWLKATRPILEAFFHAKYFLEMAVKYGDMPESEFEGPLASGWAALLYLYNLR